MDPNGVILTWNLGAERIKGYSPDEIIGRHFSVFYTKEDQERGRPAHLLGIARKEGHVSDEGWRVRKDGSRFWASVVISTLRDEDGDLIGFAKVTRDLTERKIAEDRAVADARRVALAEASNKAKTEFLTAMSHELRTPLNAIGGYAELLEVGVGGELSAKQHDYVKRIRGSQQHLLGIINDLINYGRIESGQITYATDNVDLHKVVEHVLSMVAPQARLKGVKVEHGPCHDDVMVVGDRLKIEQIVLNLLSNAVKFTKSGGRVGVNCELSGRIGLVTVSDTGQGIPFDQLDAIFEPFVQLGRTLASHQEGSGLGLSISRDLARAMGGEITVESKHGQGATFTVTLPAKK